MSILVSVDPDTVNPGVAWFERTKGDVLLGAFAKPVDDVCAFIAGLVSPGRGLGRATLICEMPQQYGGVGDRRDFLRLATVVGRLQQVAATAGAEWIIVEPRTWKGGAPKSVTSLRVWQELDAHEIFGLLPGVGVKIPASARARLEAGKGVASGEGSDVLDAVGIGLWKLGRLRARRVR